MKSKIKELMAIFIALFFACLGSEDGRKGEEKREAVIKTIKEKVESPEGLYIKEGMWRDALYTVLPFGVDTVVGLLNGAGAFVKSN